jgi:hypothetical protein
MEAQKYYPFFDDTEVTITTSKPKQKPTSYMPLCIIRYCYQAGGGDKYVFTIDDCYQNAPTPFGLLKLKWVTGCVYSDGKVTHPGPPKVGDIINDEEDTILEIIELKEPNKKP